MPLAMCERCGGGIGRRYADPRVDSCEVQILTRIYELKDTLKEI